MRLKMRWSTRSVKIKEEVAWLRGLNADEIKDVQDVHHKDHDRLMRILKVANVARKQNRSPSDVINAVAWGSDEDPNYEKIEVLVSAY